MVPAGAVTAALLHCFVSRTFESSGTHRSASVGAEAVVASVAAESLAFAEMEVSTCGVVEVLVEHC